MANADQQPTIAPQPFVPLHCHSYYSLLDGLASPEDLVARAAELGYRAMALTDHGSCGGLYDFQQAAVKAGVKPILGTEAYLVEKMTARDKDETRHHVTLWAKNAEGYRNLIGLSTLSYVKGHYVKPRIDFDTLHAMRAGLMAGTGCMRGVVAANVLAGDQPKAEAMTKRLKDIFGDDLYCEIMINQYAPEMKEKQEGFIRAMKVVLSIADTIGIKPIFTDDTHYCRKSDAFYHDVLLSIQTKGTIKNPQRFTFASADFYMKAYEQVVSRCSSRGDLISNTLEVAEKVSSDKLIVPSKEALPNFPLQPGVESELHFLKSLIRDGMMRRGIFNVQAYRDRIVQELDVITKCGFTRYFLILWDLVDYAKRRGIRMGPGRGSGAASLCLYCLDVTMLDPIKNDLMFERFLNPDRVSPPDVDLDFDDSKRDEMFSYVSQKYGQQSVTRIGTYGSLKAKDAVKRVGKALDIGGDWELVGGSKGAWKSGKNTLELMNVISKAIPNGPEVKLKDVIRGNEVKQYVERYPKVFEVAQKIEGSLSSAGVHPAGVIICNGSVSDIIPLRVTNDVLCTQFDMKEVEDLGLLKFDFLGLSTIRVVDKCVSSIRAKSGAEIDVNILEPNDPATFRMLNDGKVDGVFQFEGGGGRGGISKLLRDIRVDTFEDMIVACALFRPGTLKAKIDQDYVAYKHKKKTVEYVHPMMKELLGSTYGMMIYQEAVILVAMKMALFTPVEADYMRKGMGKKDEALLNKLKDKFVSGCVRNGISQGVAEKIFQLCHHFSKYGFNRSHSAAYAYLAYQTAWLKTHYPAEFMTSLLGSAIGDEDKILQYERASKNMGIEVLPHHINKSGITYVIDSGCIRKPLTSIRGLGEKAVEAIVAKQPFSSLNDFVTKLSGHAVNRSVFAALVESGAMEPFGMTKQQLLESYDQARDFAKKKIKQDQKLATFGAMDLFDCDV